MEYFESGYPKEYKGTKLSSDIEFGFCMWCEEMTKLGFIKKFTPQPATYRMTEPVEIIQKDYLKTKVNEKKRVLLESTNFTPDFEIEWNPQMYVILINSLSWTYQKYFLPSDIGSTNIFDVEECRQRETIITVHDTKGSNDRRGASNGSSALRFSYQVKLLMTNNNVYCTKIIPDKIYKETFVPKKWNLSPKTGKKFPRYRNGIDSNEWIGSLFSF